MIGHIPLFISAFIAEIAGTISGFGSSSILLPIAHDFFDYRTSLMIVALYHVFGNISRLSLTYHHWDKNIFFLFGIPSIITTLIGASMIEIIDPNILKIVLGGILILFALYSLWSPNFEVQATPTLGRIGGALSGFTAGLIGTGGVLRGAFMTLFGLSKERYIATIASIALVVDYTRIPLYIHQGGFSRDYLYFIPILCTIAFIGSWIGKKIIQKIRADILRKIILISIIIMSLWLGWQGYTSM